MVSQSLILSYDENTDQDIIVIEYDGAYFKFSAACNRVIPISVEDKVYFKTRWYTSFDGLGAWLNRVLIDDTIFTNDDDMINDLYAFYGYSQTEDLPALVLINMVEDSAEFIYEETKYVYAG